MPNDGGDLPEQAPAHGEAPYDPAAADESGQVPPPDPYDQGQDDFDQTYADQNGGPPPGAYGQRRYGQPAQAPYWQRPYLPILTRSRARPALPAKSGRR